VLRQSQGEYATKKDVSLLWPIIWGSADREFFIDFFQARKFSCRSNLRICKDRRACDPCIERFKFFASPRREHSLKQTTVDGAGSSASQNGSSGKVFHVRNFDIAESQSIFSESVNITTWTNSV
jgi:hypothetical protein